MRDRDSNEMLDLIFANRVYDVVTIYDWGGLASYFSSTLVSAASNNFTSFMKKVMPKASATPSSSYRRCFKSVFTTRLPEW